MSGIRKTIVSIVIAACMLPQAGCWDYTETEDMNFVIGMSFDRSADGRIVGTMEIGATSEGGQKPEYLEASGDTFFETMRNANAISDRPLYWSHTGVAIVSQDIARESMAELLDMLLRMPRIRYDLVVFVARDAAARDILQCCGKDEDLTSSRMLGALKSQALLEKAPNVLLYQFANAAADQSQSAVLPAAGLTSSGGKTTVEVSGAAVFNGAALQGFIDGSDTQPYMMLEYKKDNFTLPLPADPAGRFSSATVELYLDNVEIRPDYSEEKARVDILVRGGVRPVEIAGASADPKEFDAVTQAVVENTRAAVEKAAFLLILHTQALGGADVLGLGNLLKDRKPELWRQIGGRWRDIYRDMDVSVSAELKLRSTGYSIEPIVRGE